jgi:hypothetical protein
MIRSIHRNRIDTAGFSLIEVLIAIGIFAFSIVAVVAMLGATSVATSEAIESSTAARIADGVRAELNQYNPGQLDGLTNNPNDPLILYATRDGERVRLGRAVGGGQIPANASLDPAGGNLPGIAQRDRFFEIEVVQLDDNLRYDTSKSFIGLSVKVKWPHQLPQGPASNTTNVNGDPFMEVAPERQSMSIFNTSIRQK